MADSEYREFVHRVISTGTVKPSRCGDVIGTVGESVCFDLREGFPLLKYKKISLYQVAVELQWFLQGRTDVGFLTDRGVNIWNKDSERAGGTLGPIYGHQWRHGPTDQIVSLLARLKENPYDRRLVVSAWNVKDLPEMALPPCHYAFQVVAMSPPGSPLVLGIVVTMRSADIGLGLPYNIASYALLLELIAREVGATAGRLVINIADAHVYKNHLAPLTERLQCTLPTTDVVFQLDAPLSWFIDAELTPAVVNSFIRGYIPLPRLPLKLSVGDREITAPAAEDPRPASEQ